MLYSRRNRARWGFVKGCYCCSDWPSKKAMRAKEKRAWKKDWRG